MRSHFGGLVFLFLLFRFAGVVLGEDSVQWPGWQIETNEYTQSTRYPLSQMFDGNPATAWVYHKAWRDLPPGMCWGESDNPEENFNHGIGTKIILSTDVCNDGETFTADGIGIINGYAKNQAIYRRNNRITRIYVTCEGENQPWEKLCGLKESMQLQRISFPRQELLTITLEIDDVDVGADDDLCISELVFYNHGKFVPWRATTTVLYNYYYGCSGDPVIYYSLLKMNGQPVHHHGKPVNYLIGKARLPDTGISLLGADNTLYIYNFTIGKFIAEQTFPGSIDQLGWIDNEHAVVRISGKRGKVRWYSFILPSLRWKAIPAPRCPSFLPGTEQPYYGEAS